MDPHLSVFWGGSTEEVPVVIDTFPDDADDRTWLGNHGARED
jgi:hypothetical protein